MKERYAGEWDMHSTNSFNYRDDILYMHAWYHVSQYLYVSHGHLHLYLALSPP